MSSTNRTRWRTQRNFSKLSLSNGSVLLGSNMPDWVLGLFCFWNHPDPWSTVMIPVFCVCLWRLLYICDIIPDPYIHFFFIAYPIQGRSPAYCRDNAQRQRTIYAPIRSYNLFRIISYTNKTVVDCGGSHASSGRLYTPKCPSELVDSNPDPSCCEIIMLTTALLCNHQPRSFPEKKMLKHICLSVLGGAIGPSIHQSQASIHVLRPGHPMLWQHSDAPCRQAIAMFQH